MASYLIGYAYPTSTVGGKKAVLCGVGHLHSPVYVRNI